MGFDDDINETLRNRICLFASDQTKKLYLYTIDTQRLRLDSVKDGTFGWSNIDIRDRCFSGDFYVKICSARLSPQSKLFALQTRKGYIDFYLNMSGEKILSTKNYESITQNKRSELDLSLHSELQIGNEAIYTTLVNGESFKYPIEFDLVQPVDLTKHEWS